MIKFAVLGLLFVMMTSCSNFGANQLPPDRISYNNSLQYSDNQQILLNLVRLRYTDVPYFLSVNNVVSQFSLSKNLDVNLSNNSSNTPPAILGSADGSIGLSESPTITYTPLQGEEYVTKLLTPVDLRVIHMLLRAGWGVNQVFRMFVQRLGPLDNASLASRTTSSRLPRYKEFQRFGLIMRELQYQDNLMVGVDKVDGNFAIKLTIKSFKQLTPKQRVFLGKLMFTPKTPTVWVVGNPTKKPQQIFAQARTILGVLNYLSKGVDIPQEDIKRKLVPLTYTKNGQIFDWRKLTIGEIVIHNSVLRPNNARLAVRYKGYWFYVADEDFETKETFNILSIIMGIYQGEIKSVLPVFTVS